MAEPEIHSIPSKQRHYSGTLQDLANNLLTREIGFCTEDNRCYGKIIDSDRPEDLIPLGGQGYIDPPPASQLSLLLGMPDGSNDWVRLVTKRIGSGSTQSGDMWYELNGLKFAAQRAEKDAQGHDIQARLGGSPGIEVDQDDRVVRLTERSTFQPSTGGLIKGALQIVEGSSATRHQVHIGQSGALGALIPIVGPGKYGWVLRSNDSTGKVEWVKPAALFSSDGSIKISDNGTDPLTAALSIARVSAEKLEGYVRTDNLEDGSIPAEKLESHKRLMVDGVTISATETTDSVVLHSVDDLARGDIGSYTSTQNSHKIIAGLPGYAKPITIHIARDNSNVGKLIVRFDGALNSWAAGATELCMVCSAHARECLITDDEGADTFKQTAGMMSGSVGTNTSYAHNLVLYESDSVPTTYGVTMEISVSFLKDSVRYYARFNCAIYNVGAQDSKSEVFMGHGDTWQVSQT